MKDRRASQDRSVVIRTPDNRLRVFVSSTLNELAAERNAVRQAILTLRLAPVMFESGARPHPPRKLYQSYLAQSHIFIGIYWQSYGWVAPNMSISGLEDEYNLSASLPCLIYVKNPAANREPALKVLLQRIEDENRGCYKSFAGPDDLREFVENDLMLLLSEYFETARSEEQPQRDTKPQPLTNVPIPRNALVGREQKLADICNLLKRPDVCLLTLTGTAGVGKSRLAIQIALELRDQFKDGVYLVGLESISDAHLVIPTVAKVLGVTETAGGQPVVELLKEYLRSKEMLLLLDNFEQVLPAAPQIAELLEASPSLKLLITSRAPLRLRAEMELAIPPLRVPSLKEEPDLQSLSQYSAVRLFIQRAQSVNPDFEIRNDNAPAVADICHRLDGLPLAIELAAARAKMLPPAALLARLEHRFDLLRGGTRDLPERQRTLRGAIDWSYNLLNPDERRLLRRLSVFAGGWSLEAAEAVCNAEGEAPIAVFDGLAGLADNSLVRATEEADGEPRLSMLETIREFAYERLVACGEDSSTVGRHIHYYVTLAERAESELHGLAQQVWHRRLDRELDNLRVVMKRALAQGNVEAVLRIGAVLWRYWWTQGHWREGLGWLDAGLTRSEPVPPPVRAKALNRAGWLKRELGDYQQAVAMLQESLAIWRQIGDSAGIALTLGNIGITIMRLGDYSGATTMLEEALARRRQLGDERGIRTTLMNLGLVAFEQGDNDRAVELYGESLALARTVGDEQSVGIVLTNLGEAYANRGDYDRAEACFGEASQIYIRLGNRAGEGDVARCRGLIALKQGDCAAACRFLTEAISALRELDEKELAVLAIEGMAAAANQGHQPERAARLLSASESLRKSIGLARPPVDQTGYDAGLASARAQLGQAAFDAAWSEGSTMTWDQAAAYAIGTDATRDGST